MNSENTTRKKTSVRISRRQFAVVTAAATLSVPLLPGWLEAAPERDLDEPASPKDSGTNENDSPSAEAEALTDIVRRRYGGRLEDAVLAQIRERIEGGLKGVQAMRKVPLVNGDEPAFLFRAWRGEDHG